MSETTQSFTDTMIARGAENLQGISPEEFGGYITPKIEEALTMSGFMKALDEKELLSVKFGTDPTGPDLHMGHAVPLRVMDLFQRAGHHVDVIFGDFTAKIGDPSDRNIERPLLTDEQIATNMSTFADQVAPYVDITAENVDIHTNSTWINAMTPSDLFKYFQTVNMRRAIQRDDFRNRMEKGNAVSLAEVGYAVLMGIDSIHLQSDVELGGIDQLLNFSLARDMMKTYGLAPEQALMTPMIEGTDGSGAKMSKSGGNYIAVRAPSEDKFGKVMSIPDTLLIPYAQAFAPVHANDAEWLKTFAGREPLEFKKQLGAYIVSLDVGADRAQATREQFERRFAKKDITEADMTPLSITGGNSLVSVLGSAGDRSSSEIRRLVQQGGITVNGEKVADFNVAVGPGDVVKVGKRTIYRLTDAE